MLLPYAVDVPMARLPICNWVLIFVTCVITFTEWAHETEPARKVLTAEKFENLTKSHNQKMLDETKDAEEKAAKELSEAQARLDAKVEEVRKRADLDERRKEMEIASQQQVEQKRLEVSKREIEDRKKAAVERSKATLKQSVSSIKKNIRILAVLLCPIPAALMGLYMFMRRLGSQGRAS